MILRQHSPTVLFTKLLARCSPSWNDPQGPFQPPSAFTAYKKCTRQNHGMARNCEVGSFVNSAAIHGFMDFQELYQSIHGMARNHEASSFVNSTVKNIEVTNLNTCCKTQNLELRTINFPNPFITISVTDYANEAVHCTSMNLKYLLPANEVWDKVMFLHLCVILFTGGLASQNASQVTWLRGSASREVCLQGGLHLGREQTPPRYMGYYGIW